MPPGAAASASARDGSKEDEGRGQWHAVVTEIPYGVQKGKLIEAIAALINEKKLPILADVRDESDDEIRIVLEPRSRTVDPEMLMESLFRLTDLEIALPAQPQRARCRSHAAGDEPEGRADRVAATTSSRCCSAVRSTGWTRSTTGWNCSPAI